MIELQRGPTPSVLMGGRAKRALGEAREFFNNNSRAARQRKHDFEAAGLLTELEVVKGLQRISNSRCMFCGAGEPELRPHRFRPPQDAVAADGDTSRRHYWWLAYEWDNLYLACTDCHAAQGAKFPVQEKRVRGGGKKDLNSKEKPLLVDPFDEDPELVFIYLDSGEVVSDQSRGEITTETFDLNRPTLVAARQDEIAKVKDRLNAVAGLLERENLLVAEWLMDLYSTDHPFAALRRQFANQWVQFRPRKIERALAVATDGAVALESLVGSLRRVTNRMKEEADAAFFGDVRMKPPVPTLRRPILKKASPLFAASPEPESAREQLTPYLRGAEIRSVEIENFKAIEHLRIELPTEMGRGSWLMLLGENGAGKTSLLQALSLTLCDEKTRTALKIDPKGLLRHGSDKGRVTVTLTGSRKRCEMRFDHSDLETFGASAEGVLIAGYGSMRLLLDDRSRPAKQKAPRSKVANLFNPLSFLVQPREWLPNLRSEQFDAVARALRSLLQLGPDQEIQRSKRGLQIVGREGRLELADLSEGYKAMAVFALDMMQLFIQVWGTIEAAEGIVLVDELGAHLHPTWQMQVTESLRNTFPRVQFIATTHDPLCLRGLHDGEVVVLQRRNGHIHALHDELPPVEGLAVDQLLTSEHFGLSSSLDPEMERLFTEYYDLLSLRYKDREQEAKLDRLRGELERLRLLGRTRRERMVLEATDLFLAEEQREVDPKSLAKLKISTKSRIARIWAE